MVQLPPDPQPQNGVSSEPPPVRTKWPTVIGIISIVWGSIGIVGAALGHLFRYVNPAQAGLPANMPPWYDLYITVSSAFGLIVLLLLFLAGILLVQRKMAGRTLHLAFGALTILHLMVSIPFSVMLFSRLSMPASAPAAMEIVMIFSLLLGVLLALAYPVFLIVWFMRRQIRDEVATWGAGARQEGLDAGHFSNLR